jgi:hypothetical protein
MTSDPHGYRPGIPDQRAVLAAYRAVLHGDNDAAHTAAGAGTCPACTTVAAVSFALTIAQELAGAGFVNGPLRARLLDVITSTEDELRRAGN